MVLTMQSLSPAIAILDEVFTSLDLPGGGMKLEEKGFFVKSPHLTFAAADVVTVLEGCCCCGSLKFATKGLLLTLDTSEKKKGLATVAEKTDAFHVLPALGG